MLTAVELAHKYIGWNPKLNAEYKNITTVPTRLPSLVEFGSNYEIAQNPTQTNVFRFDTILRSESINTRSAIYDRMVDLFSTEYPKMAKYFREYAMDGIFAENGVVLIRGTNPIKITRLFSIMDSIMVKEFPEVKDRYPGNGPFSYGYEKELAYVKNKKLYVRQANTIEDFVLSPMTGEGVHSCHSATNKSERRFGNWAHLVNPSIGHFFLTDGSYTSVDGIEVQKRFARCNVFAVWHIPTGKHVWIISREYSEISLQGILSTFIFKKAKELGIYCFTRADMLERFNKLSKFCISAEIITKAIPIHYPDVYEYVCTYKPTGKLVYVTYTDRNVPDEISSKYDLDKEAVSTITINELTENKLNLGPRIFMPELVSTCPFCNKTYVQRDMLSYRNSHVCKNCFLVCPSCYNTSPKDQIQVVNGKTMCAACGKTCVSCLEKGMWIYASIGGAGLLCYKCFADIEKCEICSAPTSGDIILGGMMLCHSCFTNSYECLDCGKHNKLCTCNKSHRNPAYSNEKPLPILKLRKY